MGATVVNMQELRFIVGIYKWIGHHTSLNERNRLRIFANVGGDYRGGGGGAGLEEHALHFSWGVILKVSNVLLRVSPQI